MSVLQQAMVWRLELPHNKAWLLMALADHAHDDGTRCFPGVGQLAWKTGYGARQVRRILHDLRDDGLIAAVAFAQGGRGRATEYTLYLARGILKPPYVPDRGDRIKDDILTLAIGGNPDIMGQKHGVPGQNDDTTGRKDVVAIAAQPSATIKQPLGEPSIGWLEILRSIDGWGTKGEVHVETLIKWAHEKGWSDAQLEASALGLATTSDKVLKGYRTMAGAFQRRLNQGYDRVPVDGRDPRADSSSTPTSRSAGWPDQPA